MWGTPVLRRAPQTCAAGRAPGPRAGGATASEAQRALGWADSGSSLLLSLLELALRAGERKGWPAPLEDELLKLGPSLPACSGPWLALAAVVLLGMLYRMWAWKRGREIGRWLVANGMEGLPDLSRSAEDYGTLLTAELERAAVLGEPVLAICVDQS